MDACAEQLYNVSEVHMLFVMYRTNGANMYIIFYLSVYIVIAVHATLI